jgi:hypothetical protein
MAERQRDRLLRFKAAAHEMRCAECRVTWRSLVQRLLGIRAGFSPKVPR